MSHEENRQSTYNESDEPRRNNDLIGRSELAKRLSVNVRTVDRMVRRGELPEPCMSPGGRPRWLWSFVVDFCRKRHDRQVEIAKRMRDKLT